MRYFDEESGLHYNRFRYYDPSSGRFVSQDPIGLLGGGNLYAYVDNPNQWVDVFGLNRQLSLKQQQDRAVEAVQRLRAIELAKPASQRARVVNAIVTKDGNIITGINNRTNLTGYTLLERSPSAVQNAYNRVPENLRGRGHANCAEVCSLSTGVKRRKYMNNAVSVALNVKDGNFIPACLSCAAALSQFQIIDAVKSNGRLKF